MPALGAPPIPAYPELIPPWLAPNPVEPPLVESKLDCPPESSKIVVVPPVEGISPVPSETADPHAVISSAQFIANVVSLSILIMVVLLLSNSQVPPVG
jgi:hypothetical protein